MLSALLFAGGLAWLWWRPARRTAMLLAACVFIYLLFWVTWLAINHFTADGLTDAVVYTLLHDVGSAGVGGYWHLIVACTLALGLLVALSVGSFLLMRRRMSSPSRSSLLAWPVLLGAVCLNPLVEDAYGLARFYAASPETSDFAEHYRSYEKFGEVAKPRNIVYIYAESLERSYFDEKLFPGLMPRLSALRPHALDFADIHQVAGSEFTIGGMVASQCGTPLFAAHHGNTSSGLDTFMPGATCMGDVLADNGYSLTFMQGAALSFSGKGNFYRTHKFGEVFGRENLASLSPVAAPRNAWGYYDDHVLARAFERYQALAAKQQRFGLFVLTLDTHHYDGFLSPRCQEEGVRYRDGRNSMLNAVACSDYLIAEFIQKIRASEAGRDAVIVLASDHLAMNNPVYAQLQTTARRELLWMFDPQVPEGRVVEKTGTVLDAGVTAANLLGLGVRWGLGRDLAQEDSLRVGRENFNADLMGWREGVLAFWGENRLGHSIEVDPAAQRVLMGSQSMRLPVLLHVDVRNRATPRFAFDVEEFDLTDLLSEFKDEDRFVWLDHCELLAVAWSVPHTQGICMAHGRLGGKVEIRAIDGAGRQRIDWPRDGTVTATLGEQRRAHLRERRYAASLSDGFHPGRYGLPAFLLRVDGFSASAKVGRWTDANLAEHVRLTFAQPLPENFDLEIRAHAYGPNINQSSHLVAGEVSTTMDFGREPATRVARFRGVTDTRVVEIIPPHPRRPIDDGVSKDTRRLGLFIYSVRLLPQ